MAKKWISIQACAAALAATGLLPAAAQTVPACKIADPPTGCESNMFAASVQVDVPHGDYADVDNPGCIQETGSELERIVASAVTAANPKLERLSAPIGKLVGSPVEAKIKASGGDLGKATFPYVKRGAMCAPLVVVVPLKAMVVGFRLFGGDSSNAMGRCYLDKPPCVGGWSKFEAAPAEKRSDGMRSYYTIFKNWSHDRTRQARLTIFYTLPPTEPPPLESCS